MQGTEIAFGVVAINSHFKKFKKFEEHSLVFGEHNVHSRKKLFFKNDYMWLRFLRI